MPRRATPPDPADVADRLHSAAIHLLRFARIGDAETGVTPSRLSALSVLVMGGPQPLGRLARIEQVTAASMSVTVDRLVDARLATRKRNPADRRGTIVVATRQGARQLQAARKRRIDRIVREMGSCSEREILTLSLAATLMERFAGQDSSATN